MPTLEQTLTNKGAGTSIVLSSWSPAANELVLVAVHTRTRAISPTVAGNGFTFAQVDQQDGGSGGTNDGRVTLFRALSTTTPTIGAITVTLTGNSDNATVVATRWSSVDTSGSNGSGAVGTPVKNNGTTVDMLANITSTIANSILFGTAVHSNDTYTLQSGETAISLNLTQGTGGSRLQSSTFYESAATVTSYTLGATGSLSGTSSWGIIAVEIKPAAAASGTAVLRRRRAAAEAGL